MNNFFVRNNNPFYNRKSPIQNSDAVFQLKTIHPKQKINFLLNTTIILLIKTKQT